jgi:alpha-beta hydrolase superfamily lysophospholipase
MTERRPGPVARLAACLLFACGQVGAEPGRQVNIEFEGNTLNGWLTEVEQPRASVLMLHGTMAHANMEIMATLAEVFAEYEVETLRVSLSLGVDNRTGMFPCGALQDHRQEDALAELTVWMRWLAGEGRASVLLLGHSRGAGQVARFAASGATPDPTGLILVAPAVVEAGDMGGSYAKRTGAALQPLLREARARLDGGEPDHVLEDVAFLYCDAADATARAFLSYYGEDDGVDALDQVADLSLPAIVIAGSEDPLTARLAPEGEALARAGRITFVNVDGADHFFRDLYAYDTVEAIIEWLDAGALD